MARSHTVSEIALILGISENYVRQVERQARYKMALGLVRLGAIEASEEELKSWRIDLDMLEGASRIAKHKRKQLREGKTVTEDSPLEKKTAVRMKTLLRRSYEEQLAHEKPP